MEQGSAARAREFYRYYPSCQSAQRLSADKTLIAFAQLGALRLNVRRALISFFDCRDCYLVAEATQTLFLQTGEAEVESDRLCWGSAIIPKQRSICHYTVNLPSVFLGLPAADQYDTIPSLVVTDLSKDDRFKDFPYVSGPPYSRFYAGVPIRSPSGHNIGTYCVLDEKPRSGLSPSQLQFLKEMAGAVMRHLQMTRATEDHRRSQIMVKSLGSFAEGKNGLERWWQDPWELEQSASSSSSTNAVDNVAAQPRFPFRRSNTDQDMVIPGSVDSTAPGVTSLNNSVPSSVQSESTAATSYENMTSESDSCPQHNPKEKVAPEIKATFTRAADMILRATEVDGVAFFDAKISTFGGLVDDDILSDFPESDKLCVVLGAALRNGPVSSTQYSLSESVLRYLLKNYAHGHIFNFDNDDGASVVSSSSTCNEAGLADQRPFTMPRKSESVRSSGDEDLLQTLFPKARSLVLYPLWDALRDRWYASAIIWSSDPMRVFNSKQELSYLAAFSNSIMAEVTRLDTKLADTAKADFISSISHELRSPLHGMLGMTDLLKDTVIDSQQSSHVATIETCGKTLLETINHVLDYAKINNLTRGASRPQKRRTPNSKQMISPSKPHTNDIMTLFADVDMSTLTEDVVESVCAGYMYAKTSNQTYELISPQSNKPLVSLILDINPSFNYVFRTQPGAWRRVVMNLFGNSLKYTDEGYIKLKLEVRKRASTFAECCDFRLTVSDSGIGMSRDYIDNSLFHSFAQENPLSQGTGLGLSIVKQIVESLGGNIEVRSEKGRGTKFMVSCPLKESSFSPALHPESLEKDKEIQLRDTRERTKGLKVCIVGFLEEERDLIEGQKNKSAMKLLLKALERLCADWFKMELCKDDFTAARPDLIIAPESFARHLRVQYSQNPSQRLEAPIIVVCHGTAPAQPKTAVTIPGTTYEYINQPVGPHKLSIALSSCLRRIHDQSEAQRIEAEADVRNMASSQLNKDQPLKNAKTAHTLEAFRPPIMSASSAPELQPAGAGLTKRSKYSKPARPLTCLCVDDNPINLRLLRTFIDKLGHCHALASNGLEALNLYKAADSSVASRDKVARIDVVLMDINMPVMDGLEATRQIRAHESKNGLPKVTIIALTGVGDTEVQEEANSSGVNLFLMKPMRLAELEVILEDVVKGQDKAGSALKEEEEEEGGEGEEK